MSLQTASIRVRINDRDFTKWSSYAIKWDIFSPPSEFSLEMGRVDNDTLGWLDDGVPVEIYMDVDGNEQLLIKGRVEERRHAYAKGEHNVSIRGYDLAHDLMVSSAPWNMGIKDRTFMEVVQDLVDPWQIPICATNEVNRYVAASRVKWKKLLGDQTKDEYYATIYFFQKTFPNKSEFKKQCKAAGIPIPPHCHAGLFNNMADAKVQPGASVWDTIKRWANKAEILPFMSPDGWLTLSRPQYEQEPLFILSHRPDVPGENNVESVDESRSIDGIPTELTVYGKLKEQGKKRKNYSQTIPSEILGYATSAYDLHRPVYMNDKDARTKDDFDKRAYYALKDAEKNHWTATYTVAGHSQIGADGEPVVWVPDTTARVVDDVLGVSDVRYVSSVLYQRGRASGGSQPQITEVTLQPLNAWVPDA